MIDKTEEAMNMLYRAKWNVPKAASHIGVTSEECKETFNKFCLEKFTQSCKLDTETTTQELMESKQFEIIHLSFRKVKSEGRGVNYYIGNVVFRMLYGEGKQMLEQDMEEYESLRVSTDLELLKRYEKNLEFKFEEIDEKTGFGTLDIVNRDGIKREDVYIKAYRSNTRPLNRFLQYNEKFDCYQMREYFQDNPVVRGLIQYLQDMKDGKPNPSNTAYYHQFLCTLENLCWWWD